MPVTVAGPGASTIDVDISSHAAPVHRPIDRDPPMTTHRIALLPGDGIGPEVVAAAVDVLRALEADTADLGFDLVEAPNGLDALERFGSPLPDESLEIARSADAVLHGATDNAAMPPGVLSALRRLRRGLEVHSNVRPVATFPGLASIQQDVDVVVVRENTEGMYSHTEYTIGSDVACSVRVVTRAATHRVARTAFEMAQRRRGLVTSVHKLGGLPIGDGLFLEAVEEIGAEYPDVRVERRNIDAVAAELVSHPSMFDVIVTENQYGDILSDVAAAVAGGLGLAASGCIGDRWAYFEPIHGTAPDIAGRGIANPVGTFMATAMLLDHLDESVAAERVRGAVRDTVAAGEVLTGDLGGSADTATFTAEVIRRLGA